MYSRLDSFIRSRGRLRWEVALIQHGPVLIYWIFGLGDRYPAMVAKCVKAGPAKQIVRSEAEALERLSEVPESLGIPRLLHQENGPGGACLVVQTGAPGSPLIDHLSAGRHALLSRQIKVADHWLEEFQRAIAPAEFLGRSLEPWISRCRSVLASPTSEELAVLDRAREALDRLGTRPAVPVHGDFWACNILVDRRRVSVIDWDQFHFGTPTEDIFNFLSAVSFRIFREPTRSARTLWAAFFGTSRLAQIGAQVTHATLTRHGFTADSIRHLFTLFLLTRLTTAGFAHHVPWRAFVSSWVRAGFPEPFVECSFCDPGSDEALTISGSVPALSSR